jgi:prepilin-type processing-associated H-X9-DG protein
LPQAPLATPSSASVGRTWLGRSNFLVAASQLVVAACLLLTVVGVAVMALSLMNWRNSIVECKNNLRQFYVGFQSYRDRNGNLPDIAKESPRDVAGMFVPILHDAGVRRDAVSIRCAGIGSPLHSHLSLTDLRGMNPEDFESYSPALSMSYAYSLGYWDEAGVYHGPGDNPQAGWSQTPIMADRPPAVGILQNSMNHGGAGQNVLFADGHVKFLSERSFGAGDDIFLNRDGKVGAGLDAADIVLGYSAARPK